MTRIRGGLIVIALCASAAGARGDDRDTHRISVGASAVVFASYPMAIEDPGPALVVGKPLWLGARRPSIQWAIDAVVLAGWGVDSTHAHLAAGVEIGFVLDLGSVLGFELKLGPTAVAQLGSRSVAGLGALASGGFVFRLWPDDRRRLKLVVTMISAAYFADDPGNDLATNAGAIGAGLAYETPL